MRRYRRILTRGVATALLIAAALLAAPVVEGERFLEKDEALIERRVIPGSNINEIRVTAHSPLMPAAIFETIWEQQEHLEFVPFLKRLNLLSDTGDERVVYEQLALPLVKDRDYTVRLSKSVDRAAQRYVILIVSANDLGPPADGSHVRVTNIRGGWIIEPGPDGKGSLIRYQMQSNPGGGIPAWVVDRAERDGAASVVRAMLKRALEKNGGK